MTGTIHRNTTFDELAVGASASIERSCTAHDLFVFAHASGNTNPLNMPGVDADADGRDDAVAPAMWVGSLVSSVLGTVLPGAGTRYRAQDFRFLGSVRIGDRLTVMVRCIEKGERPVARFATTVSMTGGAVVAEGTAEVEVPLVSVIQTGRDVPTLIIDSHDHFSPLIDRAATLPVLVTAVVCPDDRHALGGALLAAERGLIRPVLIGSKRAIEAAAALIGADISALTVIDVDGGPAAAARAVAMVLSGEAQAVMKGNLHSDELLAPIVRGDGGLRLNRRISHAFVLDVPTLDHLLIVSDAAINIAPDLMAKVDITQNAIDLARACGLVLPKVGILSAVETVNPNIPSTLDAAILSKMAERGQIKGGVVDGPLAMDNAMDLEAARTKGITSLVAGHADVLIMPNLEAGNMLVKELTFVGRAEAAGLVLGARVPVILTSRADNDRARLASCALAQLYQHWRKTGAALGADAA